MKLNRFFLIFFAFFPISIVFANFSETRKSEGMQLAREMSTLLDTQSHISTVVWDFANAKQAFHIINGVKNYSEQLIDYYHNKPITIDEGEKLWEFKKKIISFAGIMQDSYLSNIDSIIVRKSFFKTRRIIAQLQPLFQKIENQYASLATKPFPSIFEAKNTKGKRLSPKEIFIVGIVFNDGLGDYYNMRAVAQALHHQFPGQRIHLLTDFYGIYDNYSRIIEPPEWLSHTVWNELSSLERKKMGDRMRNAAIIIDAGNDVNDVPQHLNHFFSDPTLRSPLENWMTIHEPISTGMLGFGKQQNGLLILPQEQSRNVHFDQWLQNFLQLNHDRAFCYVRNTEEFALSFILTNLAYFSESTKNIDIFIQWDGLFPLLKNRDLQNLLSTYGVNTVRVEKRGKMIWEAKREEIKINSEKGKTLTLINGFPIKHSHFLALSKEANSPLTGCTGDRSFAEAIARADCFPFYEILSHKSVIWDDYVLYAKEQLGNEHSYVKLLQVYTLYQTVCFLENPSFFLKHLDSFARQIDILLNDPSTLQGMQAFHRHIIKKKNSYHTLIHLVEKKLDAIKNLESSPSTK